MAGQLSENASDLAETFSLEYLPKTYGWVCKFCALCFTNGEEFTRRLEVDLTSENPVLAQRAKRLNEAIGTLRSDGCVYTVPVIHSFREFLQDKGKSPNDNLNVPKSFVKYLNVTSKKLGYSSYSESDRLGKLIYDETVYGPVAIKHVYKLHVNTWKLECKYEEVKSNALTPSSLQVMIKEQANKLPSSREFDYRSLLAQNGGIEEDKLNSYFNKDLLNLVDTITHTSKAGHIPPDLYKDTRRIRVKVAVGLLCFTVNPTSSFLQTLLGLVCYSNGLRDAGFDILNTCGVTCSIDQIRRHGKYWAKQRNMVEELSTQTLWRIAIDNLDFKLKYAKNIGSSVLKKMLNLITGQVSTRTCSRDSIPGDQLKSLAKRALSSCTVVSEPLTSITDSHFLVNKDSECDYYFSIFFQISLCINHSETTLSPVQATENFFCSLHKYMPHWTPGKADNSVLYHRRSSCIHNKRR